MFGTDAVLISKFVSFNTTLGGYYFQCFVNVMNTIWSLSKDAEKQDSTSTIYVARMNIAAILPHTDTQREGGGEREKERGGEGERDMLRYFDIFTFSREGFLLKLVFLLDCIHNHNVLSSVTSRFRGVWALMTVSQ